MDSKISALAAAQSPLAAGQQFVLTQTGTPDVNLTWAQLLSELRLAGFIITETDPVFTAWLGATPPLYPGGWYDATQNSVSLSGFNNNLGNYGGWITGADVPVNETDPVFTAWLGGDDMAAGNFADGNNYGAAFGAAAYGSTYGAAVGSNANGSNYGVVVGSNADGSNYGVAVGSNSYGSNYGVAVGSNSDGHGLGNFAVCGNDGSGANAVVPDGYTDTIELGRGTATDNGSLHFRGNRIADGSGNLYGNGDNLTFTDNSGGANWAGSPPATLTDAINRIAAVVSVGGTVPIP